jgi:glycosyltransferase involved in cell wall biosynthesis
VAYDGGGVGSIVTPEVGRLTERDPARLGAAVREVLELAPDTRAEMTRRGRARAEERYDYNRLVAKLERWLAKAT